MIKVSIEEAVEFRKTMFDKSLALVSRKGADYNRDQQASGGNSLFNLQVCELLGVAETAERGILVRLCDKIMRLVSLAHPDRDPANSDESLLDTVADVHNYVDYLALLHTKRQADRRAVTAKPEKLAPKAEKLAPRAGETVPT